MTSNDFFNNQPFGVLMENPLEIYKRCRSERRTFTKVVERKREARTKYIESIFNSIFNITGSSQPSEYTQESFQSIGFQSTTEEAKDVLWFFQGVHKQYKKHSDLFDNVSSNRERDCRFSEIIFMEIGSFLLHEFEYILMLYKYLLHLGIRMPQLFVIVNYPTTLFNFISTDIFEMPVPEWKLPAVQPGRNLVIFKDKEKKVLTPNFQSITSLEFIPSNYESDAFTRKVHIVISPNDIFNRLIIPILNGSSKPENKRYDHRDGLEGFDPEKVTEAGNFTIILLNSVEELLESNLSGLNSVVVILDKKSKIEVDAYYACNIPRAHRMNDDYLHAAVWKINNFFKSPPMNIYLHSNEDKTQEENRNLVVRGVMERNPINDYITMALNGINMLTVYANYYKGSGSNTFLSVIRSNVEQLKELGYFTKDGESIFRKAPQLRLHPIMISIINKWVNYEVDGKKIKLPILPILLFVAIAMTSNNQLFIPKEHGSKERGGDVSQTSSFGQALTAYLILMEQYGTVLVPETAGGKTSRLLEKLINIYIPESAYDDEMGLPDHNELMKQVSAFLIKNYPKSILHQRGQQQTEYRGSFNYMMRWKISPTPQSPAMIFPLVVYGTKGGKYVKYYAMLDKV